MKFSCGTDIVEVERIEKIIEEKPEFVNKIFTDVEIKYCMVSNKKQTIQHFAGRFAAKEAIYKAISDSDIKVKEWKDIEIVNREKKYSKPYVKINGKRIENIDLSISHESKYATAMAIFEK